MYADDHFAAFFRSDAEPISKGEYFITLGFINGIYNTGIVSTEGGFVGMLRNRRMGKRLRKR